MIAAGFLVITFFAFLVFLLVRFVDLIPKAWLKLLGYLLLFGSTIETVFLAWIIVYIVNSEWTLWNLSIDVFWREQLPAIYFIKEWMYVWFWNDALDFFFVYLPAVILLSVRTTVTSMIGGWVISKSKTLGISSKTT